MTVILLAALIILLLLMAFLTLQYSLLIPPKAGLPVLMYHKISKSTTDGLTVTTLQFEQHLLFLSKAGYRTIGFDQLKALLNNGDKLPPKTMILTFDDAYQSFTELALPLLQKYGFTATVFVPVAFMGKTNFWDRGSVSIMDEKEIKRLVLNNEIRIGLHSFMHHNYAQMTAQEMEEDLDNCRKALEYHGIPFDRVLAYPYGGFPKKDPQAKEAMIGVFNRFKLDFALRIGNRINSWPIRNPFEIKRIDIRGTDSFFIFRTKVRKGRAKLFA